MLDLGPLPIGVLSEHRPPRFAGHPLDRYSLPLHSAPQSGVGCSRPSQANRVLLAAAITDWTSDPSTLPGTSAGRNWSVTRPSFACRPQIVVPLLHRPGYRHHFAWAAT